MKAVTFEEPLSWKKAKELARLLYLIMRENRDYGFKDQLLRAGVSVMNNIAEGFERNSRKEFKQFLSIAKGSCGEVRSMLILGKEINYISEDDFEKLNSLTVEISKLLYAFMRKIDC